MTLLTRSPICPICGTACGLGESGIRRCVVCDCGDCGDCRRREDNRIVHKQALLREQLCARAHAEVAAALRAGELTRAPCEICGMGPAEGHHDDYSEPLVVRWLCPDHHRSWHLQNTPVYPTSEARV